RPAGGRCGPGIGAGGPGIGEGVARLGLPPVPPAERLARMRETVAALRELDGPDRHTPVVMAVSGPKARALAAEVADTVTFALHEMQRTVLAGRSGVASAARDEHVQ